MNGKNFDKVVNNINDLENLIPFDEIWITMNIDKVI